MIFVKEALSLIPYQRSKYEIFYCDGIGGDRNIIVKKLPVFFFDYFFGNVIFHSFMKEVIVI